MSLRPALKTNRDIERYYFEQFSEAYKLPNGTAEYADRPDVILKGERAIGIEMTSFYLRPGGSSDSEQKQKPRRDGVVSNAHKLHRRAGGKNFELTFEFNPDRPITSARKKILPKELAALAVSINAAESGPIDADLFEGMPEVSSIYLNSKEYENARWSVCQVYSVDLMSAVGLEKIVREKESKVVDYLPCDAYWLLIIVDWRDNAQEQEISVEGVKITSDVFERIIVYKPGFEDIVEVWP
jgi:hypothetical protein